MAREKKWLMCVVIPLLAMLLWPTVSLAQGTATSFQEQTITYTGSNVPIASPNTPATNFNINGQNQFIIPVANPSYAIRVYVTNNTPNACSGALTAQLWAVSDPQTNSFINSLNNWQVVPIQSISGTPVQTFPVNVPASGITYFTSTAIAAPKVTLQLVNTSGGCATTSVEVTGVIFPVAVSSPLISVSGPGGFSSGLSANVQGVIPQLQNGSPVFPVIGGGLQPPINSNFTATGLDNFSSGIGGFCSSGSACQSTTVTAPFPAKAGELALAFESTVGTAGGAGNPQCPGSAASCVIPPWTPVPGTACAGGSPQGCAASLANPLNGQPLVQAIGQANISGFNVGAILLLNGNGTVVPAVRQGQTVSGLSNAFPSNVLASSALFVAVGCAGTTPCTVSSVTDTLGLTYKQVLSQNGVSTFQESGIIVFMATSLTGSSAADTVTVTMGTGSQQSVTIAEVTGTTPSSLTSPAQSLQVDANGNLKTIFSTTTNTTTGDAGTFTASFAGATQTNSTGRGAIITVLLGTVSGTTPTLAVQPQYSPDGGTTWLNFGPVLPNLTATGQSGSIFLYPTNTSTAGATPAAFTVGTTVTIQSNVALPRFWRLNYTIGGTTPSFAINSVQVNYIQ